MNPSFSLFSPPLPREHPPAELMGEHPSILSPFSFSPTEEDRIPIREVSYGGGRAAHPRPVLRAYL